MRNAYIRIPLKWAVFALVTFWVLFPSPSRFVEHCRRMADLEAMIEPNAPGLAVWEDEVRTRLAENPSEVGFPQEGENPGQEAAAYRSMDRRIQSMIERVVLEKVAYAWDWDTWGMVDYMPTVGEMLQRAKADRHGLVYEDCDGRAVMAASIMRRFGYNARMVTDLRHIWVVTDEGQWMGPGRDGSMVSSEAGNELDVGSVPGNLLASFSFGVAVYPFGREVFLLVVGLALLFHRGVPARRTAWGALLMIQGLLFMRFGAMEVMHDPQRGMAWASWLGLAHLLAGCVVLIAASHHARRRAPIRL